MLNRSAIMVKPKEPFLDWLHDRSASGSFRKIAEGLAKGSRERNCGSWKNCL